MKVLRLNRLTFICLSVACGTLCIASALASCSSNGGAGASSEDGAADQTTDVVASDAVGDAEPGVDASVDSSSDVIAVSDSPPDGEAGQGDAEAGCPIALPTEGDFVNAVVTLACQRTQACCLVSASQFDLAECVTAYSNSATGGWLSVALVEPYVDSGLIGFDPASACQCLMDTANVGCGFLSAQFLTASRSACTQALPGLSPIDGGCASSFECVPPSAYCTGTDGGTCMPLVPEGGPCTVDDMCSYGALGNPSRYCDTTTSQTCVPRFSDDAGCQRSAQCASNICLGGSGGVSCQSSGVFSDPGVAGGLCDFFTIKDAGDGG
jgi:hypothetical protein